MNKKILLSALLISSVALGVRAQDYYTAATLLDDNYYGTARSLALGNAMTALGGDLGSVTINPAGSAVSHFGQFTISPGLSLSVNRAAWSPGGESPMSDFGYIKKKRRGSFDFSNIGINLYLDSEDKSSVISGISFGFTVNSTANYNDKRYAAGNNPYTSISGAMAWAAQFNPSVSSDAAYDAYMIDKGEMSDDGQMYLGIAEQDYNILSGPLSQQSTVRSYGSKGDVAFNLGLNMQDRFYLGFNLGIVTVEHRYRESFYEESVDPSDFSRIINGKPTHFNYLDYSYDRDIDGGGLYVKTGFIWVPADWLRIGATVQTPTWYDLTQYEYANVYTDFTDVDCNYVSGDRWYDEWDYTMTTPWKFGLGAAMTFLDRGLLSVDYEYEDLSSITFRGRFGESDYRDLNSDIAEGYGARRTLRVGLEYRLTPELSVRTGHTRTGSIDGKVVSWAIGGGYSPDGPFFADIAIRKTRWPEIRYTAYQDYVYAADSDKLVYYSPTIASQKSLFDIVLTLGYRF